MENFEIRFPKTDLLGIGAIYLVFIIIGILMFALDYNFRLSVIFMLIILFFGGISVIPTCLFYVKVKDNNFKVRTQFGKKYEFSINEISKVVCSKHYRMKLGTQYTIDIITGNNNLELNSKMKNFDIIAEYLVDKYESGQLEKVMSKSCRNSLKKLIPVKQQ